MPRLRGTRSDAYVAVAAGQTHFIAASRQGKVYVWGKNDDDDDHDGVRKIPTGLGLVTAVSAGTDFTVVLQLPKSAAISERNSAATDAPESPSPRASMLGSTQAGASGVVVSAKTTEGKPLRAALETLGPQQGENWTIPKLNLEMIPVPAGMFALGGNHTGLGEKEHPITTVMLTKPFWLGRTAVTQMQYESVIGHNPSNSKGPNQPVEKVSWNDATEFCRKLTEQERAAGRLPEDCVYILPTEAQREYLCRAGSTEENTANIEAISWHGSVFGRTHPVGEKQANAWGFYDMQGNVYEWCGDWVGDYPGGSVNDPKGPVSGDYRIIRGGAFNSPASFCRSTFRWEGKPDSRKLNVGFRVALGFIR